MRASVHAAAVAQIKRGLHRSTWELEQAIRDYLRSHDAKVRVSC